MVLQGGLLRELVLDEVCRQSLRFAGCALRSPMSASCVRQGIFVVEFAYV